MQVLTTQYLNFNLEYVCKDDHADKKISSILRSGLIAKFK